MRKCRVFCILCLLIGFSSLISYSQLVDASPIQADNETIVNSTHIYERPYDEGFPTWEIILNISGPTPDSTLQEYNVSLDFIASGSQEGVEYSREKLTLNINDTIISSSITSQTNYTGNINDTVFLREGDVVNAQFHCNTTKERIEERCYRTLGFTGSSRLANLSFYDDVAIFLECNITLGEDSEGLHTVDSDWFIEYTGSPCKGLAPWFYLYTGIGAVLIGIVLFFVIRRLRKNKMTGTKKV